jgi:hypothetical protein
MRRVLNLNGPSRIFLRLIGLFAILIPAVFYSVLHVVKQPEINFILRSIMQTSFTIGAVLFAILLGLIVVEQIQDHYIDMQYQKNRDRKRPLADGNYECQYCGNRGVKENDKTCRVCGKELR